MELKRHFMHNKEQNDITSWQRHRIFIHHMPLPTRAPLTREWNEMALFKSNTARVESRKAISLFKWRIIIALLLFSNLRARGRLWADCRLICVSIPPRRRTRFARILGRIPEQITIHFIPRFMNWLTEWERVNGNSLACSLSEITFVSGNAINILLQRKGSFVAGAAARAEREWLRFEYTPLERRHKWRKRVQRAWNWRPGDDYFVGVATKTLFFLFSCFFFLFLSVCRAFFRQLVGWLVCLLQLAFDLIASGLEHNSKRICKCIVAKLIGNRFWFLLHRNGNYC